MLKQPLRGQLIKMFTKFIKNWADHMKNTCELANALVKLQNKSIPPYWIKNFLASIFFVFLTFDCFSVFHKMFIFLCFIFAFTSIIFVWKVNYDQVPILQIIFSWLLLHSVVVLYKESGIGSKVYTNFSD